MKIYPPRIIPLEVSVTSSAPRLPRIYRPIVGARKMRFFVCVLLSLSWVCVQSKIEEVGLFNNYTTYEFTQRRLLEDEALPTGNGRPPAWKARFDPRYEDSYIAPARIKNSCGGGKKCEGIPGKRYPYDEYILDPTTSGDKQPVIRIWYPKGSWSPGSKYPGGMLMFVYPYKSHPTKDVNNPLSAVSAAMEYEVFMPSDFDCVKGGKLMGMSGGRGGGRGCGGGADPAHCFNVGRVSCCCCLSCCWILSVFTFTTCDLLLARLPNAGPHYVATKLRWRGLPVCTGGHATSLLLQRKRHCVQL